MIPAEIRRRYGIKTGTEVRFIERDNHIVIQPVTKEFIRSLCGRYKGEPSMLDDLLKERANDRKMEERKLERFRSR